VLAPCFIDLVCVKNPDVREEDVRLLLWSTTATSIIAKGTAVSDDANAIVLLFHIIFRYLSPLMLYIYDPKFNDSIYCQLTI